MKHEEAMPKNCDSVSVYSVANTFAVNKCPMPEAYLL